MIKSIDNLIEGLKVLEQELILITENIEKQRLEREADIALEKNFKEECIKLLEKYK